MRMNRRIGILKHTKKAAIMALSFGFFIGIPR
jgi:hypothetical protein